MQRSRAVMLRNKINYSCRQTHFPCQFCAVSYVADDNFRALRRFQTVVRISARLIFDKMFGRGGFSDVVIKCADACQQTVCADDAAGIFRQLSDGVRMLIRAGGAKRELSERGQILSRIHI